MTCVHIFTHCNELSGLDFWCEHTPVVLTVHGNIGL